MRNFRPKKTSQKRIIVLTGHDTGALFAYVNQTVDLGPDSTSYYEVFNEEALVWALNFAQSEMHSGVNTALIYYAVTLNDGHLEKIIDTYGHGMTELQRFM